MKATREEMKAEAIERMKLLGLGEDVIASFEKGKLMVSATGFGMELLEPISDFDDPDLSQLVKKTEDKMPLIVFHVLRGEYAMGLSVALLYVWDNPDEWEYEKSLNQKDQLTAFVTQIGDREFKYAPDCGSIRVKEQDGMLIRTQ